MQPGWLDVAGSGAGETGVAGLEGQVHGVQPVGDGERLRTAP
jgi:hypothetical protein